MKRAAVILACLALAYLITRPRSVLAGGGLTGGSSGGGQGGGSGGGW